ncbi:TM2 domain-containing protein [Metabacillus halosaccharovorans]|uniref:TM2 domain-containing protein n=1 Tax=Metabacillus halosaccharovorans TaxID=930124 RepID=A0ABT3DL44_9BACI|nr:TM2 domain-containing protein [Metabacillus halosaccharovorans]MBU7592224.1 TM2 domain-containing protein [Metabacillus halosaccharovorans]MCV9887770.1 TM2 domain-containing protein [Metabacillus halosaccharovorans]
MSQNIHLKQNLDQQQQAILASEFDKRKKSKVVTFLLWFFLGTFGAHRFYTGQTGYAIAMLLLGWATLGIWPFIDGIVCLVSKVDSINEEIERDIIAQLSTINKAG